MYDAVRAKEWVISKYQENTARFENQDYGKGFEYGKMDCDTLLIVPSVLNRFLKDGGFNPERVKADFVQRGWLKQFEAKDGTRKTKLFDNYGSRSVIKRGYCYHLMFPEWSPGKRA